MKAEKLLAYCNAKRTKQFREHVSEEKKRLDRKVLMAAKHGMTSCYFEVLPSFRVQDVGLCVSHLEAVLRKEGFDVEVHQPNILHIVWERG